MRDHLPEDDELDLRAFPRAPFDDVDALPRVAGSLVFAARVIGAVVAVSATLWVLHEAIKLAAFYAANPDFGAFGRGRAW